MLSSASARRVTVRYATTPGSAKAGEDFTRKTGLVVFNPRQRSRTVAVPIRGEGALEPNETFSVVLSRAAGARIADGRGIATILDDDARASLRAPLTGESFYFLMPDRFEDGSDANDTGGLPGDDRLVTGFDPTHKGFFHGGDLAGLQSRLGYIKDLGTTAIWLTPIFENKPVQGSTAGYHGQWITDFTQVDPHYGTNEQLAALIAAAHAQGMKVFFDVITNHTADVITYAQKPGGPAPSAYVSKDAVPYRSASGAAFDDRDVAGASTFPLLSAETSFPFAPQQSGQVKTPSWLNDMALYHNRGDTTFVGENAEYGDFFGLDDLFTEHPDVVSGMTEIYKDWITDFGIDGFRLDTMKHVNDEFWQSFAPEVLAHARASGKAQFFMFGEVFDTTRPFTSQYTTRNRVQAVADFPFQAAAQAFAANSAATEGLEDFFVADDWYTDADSNVYQLPTFLGNHDMGRIGFWLRAANPGASEAELLARSELAHGLMFLSRGNPTVYYGDEQGFVGDGGDQDARQDMFPSQVPSYNDDDNIGSSVGPSVSNFDPAHPLYAKIAELAQLTKTHPALRNGPQQHRFSLPSAGIYAFSRYDRANRREYVVALNNSETAQEADVQTSAGPGSAFAGVYGSPAPASTDGFGRLSVSVPALSAIVYRSSAALPRATAAPGITLAVPGGPARGRVPVSANVLGSSFYDVTFQAKIGTGAWTTIGTDDNAPYRVFHDLSEVAPGTTVAYRAGVLDNAGNRKVSPDVTLQVAEPSITITAPTEGAGVRDTVELAAQALPDRRTYSVTFERSTNDGASWTPVRTDDSQPVYAATDDISELTGDILYRAVLTYAAGKTVVSASRSVSVAPVVTTAVIHYKRPGGDYSDWGLHLWGDGVTTPTADWGAPQQESGIDDFGAYFNVPLTDDTKRLWFIVHRPSGDTVPDTREPGGDRSFVPMQNPEIWLVQGDPTIYLSPPP